MIFGININRPNHVFISVGLLCLLACQRESNEPTVISQTDWEKGSSHIIHLPATDYPSPTFKVFSQMASAESLLALEGETNPEKGPPSNVSWSQMVDTLFSFPSQPLEIEAYGIDVAAGGDSLFRKAYSQGIYQEELPCGEGWVFKAPFNHPTRWLKPGMTQSEIQQALGNPDRKSPEMMRYSRLIVTDTISRPIERILLLFEDDSLSAIRLRRDRPCHHLEKTASKE